MTQVGEEKFKLFLAAYQRQLTALTNDENLRDLVHRINRSEARSTNGCHAGQAFGLMTLITVAFKGQLASVLCDMEIVTQIKKHYRAFSLTTEEFDTSVELVR